MRAVDAGSGDLKWSYEANAHDIRIGEGQVFLLCDQRAPLGLESLDLTTGEQKWRLALKAAKSLRVLFCKKGILVVAGDLDGVMGNHALSAQDGKRLWSYTYECSGASKPNYVFRNVFYVGERVWVYANARKDTHWLALDPASGEVKGDFVLPPKAHFKRRCNGNRATERYLIDANFNFFDWEAEKHTTCNWARGGCGYSAWTYYGIGGGVPANGLIYGPPHNCWCSIYLRGFLALAPAGAEEQAAAPQLVRGPAFGASAGKSETKGEWLTWRGNPARSGATEAAVPAKLEMLWEAKLDGRLTAPTVGDGAVLVAEPEAHRLHALEAASGERRWSFTAGGRIDSPPTILGNLAVFGCRDGRVYCLKAADGKLVWRLRAAPAERLIVANERLESAWPVHGSVLVEDGKVYFAAGRHTFVDGGVNVGAVEAASGKVLWENRVRGAVYGLRGIPSDVLVGAEEKVYMGCWAFDAKSGEDFRGEGSKYQHFTGRNRIRIFDRHISKRTLTDGRGASAKFLVWRGKKTYCADLDSTPDKYDYDASSKEKGGYKLFVKVFEEGATVPKDGWSVKVPLRIKSMLLAGDTLFVSGLPLEFEPKGGELWAFSAADGKKLGAMKFDGHPVEDGLAAAGGKLYLSTLDGKLLCFGKK